MINVKNVTKLQREKTDAWHHEAIQIASTDFLALVEENHRHNFELWHEEDKARRDDCGFEYVYNAKRNIDRSNQQRNNCMEKMDTWIFQNYQPATENCPVNSESPGMMIDRLSILALKEYHMNEQVVREDAAAAHKEKCEQKLVVIRQQLVQLETCLGEFLQALTDNTRTFRVYHQFKMYNDAALNPQLYKNTVQDAS